MSTRHWLLWSAFLTCSCSINAPIERAWIVKSGEHIRVGDQVFVNISKEDFERILSHKLMTHINISDCRTGYTYISLALRYREHVSGDFYGMRIALSESSADPITISGRFDVPLRRVNTSYCVSLESDGYSFYRLQTNSVEAEVRIAQIRPADSENSREASAGSPEAVLRR